MWYEPWGPSAMEEIATFSACEDENEDGAVEAACVEGGIPISAAPGGGVSPALENPPAQRMVLCRRQVGGLVGSSSLLVAEPAVANGWSTRVWAPIRPSG